MKKLIFAYVAGLVMLLAVQLSSAGSMVESPAVKIVIDGKKGSYTDVPVIKNGRTLLPLRAVLVNLGVPNDDGHIIWNGAKRTVTVIKDSTNIELKVDNTKALVNKASVTLDVAPLIYKKRTYIPARFVAQSLGKKVTWDGTTRTVAICDESSFQKIKDIMDKSDKAMNRYKSNSVISINFNDFVDNKTEMAEELDSVNKTSHKTEKSFMNGSSEETETYIIGNYRYDKKASEGEWTKTELTQDEKDAEFSSLNEGYGEVFLAGLKITSPDNSDEIVLEGDIAPDAMMEDAMDDIGYKANTKIIFDKKTYMVKELHWNGSGSTTINGTKFPYVFKADFQFQPLDNSFEIKLPAGINLSQDTTEGGFSVYENPDLKIRMNYPSGWSKKEGAGNLLAIFYTPAPSDSYSFLNNVNLAAEDLGGTQISLDEYTDKSIKQLAQTFTDFKLTASESTTLSGLPSHKLVFTGKMGQNSLQWEQVYAIKNGKAYIITYTAEPSSFQIYMKDFEDMLSSVSIN